MSHTSETGFLSEASEHAAEPSDRVTTVEDLKKMMYAFVDERQWWKFHTPKNLAGSVSIEAAELLEHFQWLNGEAASFDECAKEKIGEEMSDVLAYLISLANVLNIDLACAFRKKMRKNARKYPSGQFQGTWEKVRES